MAINNCLFSPTSENLLTHSSHFVLVSRGFSVWCVLAKLTAKPRNYS